MAISKKLAVGDVTPEFYKMKNTIDMKGLKSVSPKIEKKEMRMRKEKKMKNLKPSYSYPKYA